MSRQNGGGNIWIRWSVSRIELPEVVREAQLVEAGERRFEAERGEDADAADERGPSAMPMRLCAASCRMLPSRAQTNIPTT